MSHSAEEVCRGILQCFSFSEYRKVVCVRGVSHDFLSKTFSLTVVESFVGEPFCVSEFFSYRIILWIRGGGGGTVNIFCRKFFVAQCRKVS